MVNRLFSCRVLILLCLSTKSLAETVIKITNGEWEPYMSQYIYQYGLDSHIVTEAFALEGITVEWGFFPWARSYFLAENAQGWDASCCWWPTMETRNTFFVSEPFSQTSFVFFHLKNVPFDWRSVDDLAGLKIGGTIGYDYGKAFMEAMEKKRFQVEFVSSDEINYQKLLYGRIQVFPNDPVVGYSQIRNTLGPEEAKLLTHHPKQFGVTTLNLIISKKSERGVYFLEKFNAGLNKLKESGRYSQMYNELDSGKYDKRNYKWSDTQKIEIVPVK